MNAIKLACYRVSEWQNTTSADLVAAITHPSTMESMTLAVAFKEAVQIRLIDVVAAELGETAPETVTAAGIDTALGR